MGLRGCLRFLFGTTRGLVLVAIAAIALQTALFGTLSGPLADLGVGDAVVRGRDMRA